MVHLTLLSYIHIGFYYGSILYNRCDVIPTVPQERERTDDDDDE